MGPKPAAASPHPAIPILVVAFLAGLTLPCAGLCAQYHTKKYLLGVEDNTLPLCGALILDATRYPPTATTLAGTESLCHVTMDADNEHVLVSARGSSGSSQLLNHGVFRVHPTTRRFTTVYAVPYTRVPALYFFQTTIDQDGNYLVVVSERTGGPGQNEIWKVKRSGVVSTVLARTALGVYNFFQHGRVQRDIDTGLHLVTSNTRVVNGLSSPVFELDTSRGTITTWHAGHTAQVFSSLFHRSLPQNYRNGHLEGVIENKVVRMGPGKNTVATLATLGTSVYNGDRAFDLQSAARPCMVSFGSWVLHNVPPAMLFVDAQNFSCRQITVPGFSWDARSFAFYGGRHTQPVLIGPRTWQIHLSAPGYPGKAYFAALGASGVRPGVPLADGRRILLNPDVLTALTGGNQIPMLWKPGPGVLNAKGRATATLDLRGTRAQGMCIWIAWVVLDPQAPLGIAYIPDPYVMRI